ncbi:hypothetical protein KHA96_16705 [Bacillus sp. FJAT-49711]|uniref:hypothetical protein n=1 Tax=Bacillus sp. FJAT-49711 TaxID=2833585 RepID=UPI001BC9B532|nr:hypothetical protein [Bacillus sp. FJAT-49711]MBS4219954.1 hypothetical protein [Bacillus sp. FJAT-49711]
MKNILLLIISACILLGTVFLTNGQFSQNALLFVGIISLIMLVSVLIVSKLYPDHKTKLTLSICAFVLLLFVPSLAALTDINESLENAAFKHFLIMFILLPVIFIGSVVLAYRQYFIKEE